MLGKHSRFPALTFQTTFLAVFAALLALGSLTDAADITNLSCLRSRGDILDWHADTTWPDGVIPSETDNVVLRGCIFSISRPVHVASITMNATTHLIVNATQLTITGDFHVGLGLVTLVGNTSVLTTGTGLQLSRGALTGSGTINGNVVIGFRSEIDIFEVNSELGLGSTGFLRVNGNMTMKHRPPSFNARDIELPHATIALGLQAGVRSATGNSRLLVSGRMFIELMSLSLLFNPSRSAYGDQLPSDLITATQGFFFDPSISEPLKISTVLVNQTGPGNYVYPPFPFGIHVGRFTPTPNTVVVSDTGGIAISDGSPENSTSLQEPPGASGCSQPSGSSLVILFGGSQCSLSSVTQCATGTIFDSTTQSCVPQCPDMTCSGHGTCAASNGAATCSCSFGWTGTNCQLGDCPIYQGAVCNLRGTCNVPAAPGQPATCSCQSGFAEPDCRPPITLTPTPQNSEGSPSGSGSDGNTLRCGSVNCTRAATACSASNTSCVCVQGFGGVACEQAQCPNQCSGHGVCDGSRVPPVCQCTGNWLGDDCNTAGGAAATDNNNNTNGGLASQSIAGISAPAFIGIMAAVGLIVLVAIVVIIVVAVNKTAKRAVRPFTEREVTRDDDL